MIKEILIIIFSVMFISMLSFPLVKKIAYHINALDIPNERKVHKNKMPLLGGLIIYIGFLFGYILYMPKDEKMIYVIIASMVIILTGIIDDIKPLSAKHKLIGQIISALIIVSFTNLLISDISFFDYYINFGILKYPITIIFIVSLINCINLIDGLDGLAGGISAIFFLTIGILACFFPNITSLEIILSFIMFGACLGFLVFNFHPAKIFMGDTGSMFLGFMISIICLMGFKTVTLTSFLIPIVILTIPILDTLFAIIRRIINKKPIYEADKKHLHHQLLNKKFSQRVTVLIIYLASILFSLATIIYVLYDRKIAVFIYTFLIILIIWFVLKTDIIVDKAKIHIFHFDKKNK